MPLLAALDSTQWTWLLAGTAAFVVLVIGCTAAIRRLEPRSKPGANVFRATRNVLLPLLLALVVPRVVWRVADTPLKVLETLIWVAAIHVALAASNSLMARPGRDWRGRMPKLFFDIVRALLLLVGVCIVISGVWGWD